MPLDPQFRAILDTLGNSGLVPLVRGDAVQTRAHYRTLSLSRRGPGFVPEEVASVADLRSPGGVPVRIFEPASPGGFTLIYLHGGGWVVGDVETHDPLCRRVANQTGARVVSVGYRLAPEHPFPAGLDDAEEVLRWLRAGEPGRPVGVAGDVAGVATAIVATAEFDPLRDEGAAYAARLKDAGVPVDYVPGPGLIHGFAAFLGVVDAAEANLEAILASLGRLMRSQAAST
jgi:acetyl esterase